jgi:hypothetical protein
VADYLGTTVEKINNALVFAPLTSSIDAPFGEDEYTLLDKVLLEGAGTDQAPVLGGIIGFEVMTAYIIPNGYLLS